MRTVAVAISEILGASPELQFGFSQGLFNLTQLAKFIRPMVEARTHKEVQESSLVMALSRLQRSGPRGSARTSLRFSVENISVLSNLTAMTLHRSDENHRAVEQVHARLRRKGSYLTVSEGTSEITVIFHSEHRALVTDLLPSRPKLVVDKVASLSVRFHTKYLDVPGLLYKILEQISLQGINLIEIASTATEFIIYMKEADIRLAFDTILRAFVR